MILRMLSAFVPRSELEMYLEHLRIKTIPAYEAAAGLISVALVRRHFVEYVEVATISTWESEETMTRFLGEAAPIDPLQPLPSLLEWEAHIYQMVVARNRMQSDERSNPCPECRNGTD